MLGNCGKRFCDEKPRSFFGLCVRGTPFLFALKVRGAWFFDAPHRQKKRAGYALSERGVENKQIRCKSSNNLGLDASTLGGSFVCRGSVPDGFKLYP